MQEFQEPNNKITKRKKRNNHWRNNSKNFPRTEEHEFQNRKGQIMSNKTDKIPKPGHINMKFKNNRGKDILQASRELKVVLYNEMAVRMASAVLLSGNRRS